MFLKRAAAWGLFLFIFVPGVLKSASASKPSLLNAVMHLTASEVRLGTGTVRLRVNLVLDEDFEYTEEAPFFFEWSLADPGTVQIKSPAKEEREQFQGHLEIELEANPGRTILNLYSRIYYCRKTAKTCLFKQIQAEIPIRVETGGAVSQDLTLRIGDLDA